MHELVAYGVFLQSGNFRVLPPLPEASLSNLLRGQNEKVIPTEAM